MVVISPPPLMISGTTLTLTLTQPTLAPYGVIQISPYDKYPHYNHYLYTETYTS
jgi:hypothetical protein